MRKILQPLMNTALSLPRPTQMSRELHRQARRLLTLPLIMTAIVLLFLYIPMASMIVYSFNESKLVTLWSGFSLHWYSSLLSNTEILTAAGRSIRIALIAATLATVLGVLAGFALVRFKRFRGKSLLMGLVTAPLVMPDLLIGVSLLLLFIGLDQLVGWPARGSLTIIIAHSTFCIAYVAVIIQARVRDLDPMLEEAAMDLGARRWTVFFLITLPIIMPAIIAGWLLSFVLSWDDLVIASFVTGPESNTLPIVIFSKVRRGLSPEINALASIVIFVVTIAVIVAMFLIRRQERAEASGTKK